MCRPTIARCDPHFLFIWPYSMKIGASRCVHRSPHDVPNSRLMRSVRCSLTRSTAPICAHAADGDRVDSSPLDRHALRDAIRLQRARSVYVSCIYEIKRDIVPHGENEWTWREYNVGPHNANALPPQYYN